MKAFSFGIFGVIFITLSILSVCLSGGYFYMDGKRAAEDAVENARRYSLPLAEALSEIAENCYIKKDYSRLKILLNSDIFKKNIKEAFFVLADGIIIAHSDTGRVEKLQGKISNDNKAYDAEKLLLSLKSKSSAAQFLNYNIRDVKSPFGKDTMKRLSGYFNNKLDITGWLVSKAVIINGNGIGCVCFLLGKDRLYKSVERIYIETIYLFTGLLIISVLIALVTAASVYMRLKGMTADNVSADIFSFDSSKAVKDAVRIAESAEPGKQQEQIKIFSWEMTVPYAEDNDKELSNDPSKLIKDAIPVSGE